MPEMAITLDFNVKNGPVVKTTPLIKEPESVERNFELLTCLLWQYGLWGFQTRDTKFEIFLPKKQLAHRRLLT